MVGPVGKVGTSCRWPAWMTRSPTTRSRSSAPGSPASARRSSSTEPGFDDYVLLEEGDGVGGAWHWNTYPGVARRHPVVQLPVLLRAARRLVAGLRPGRRAQGLRRALRRQVRPAPTRSASDARVTAATFDDERAPLAARRSSDGDDADRALRGRRDRRAHPAQAARHRRASTPSRGTDDAHRALGPRRTTCAASASASSAPAPRRCR